jgi:hypothetical protein
MRLLVGLYRNGYHEVPKRIEEAKRVGSDVLTLLRTTIADKGRECTCMTFADRVEATLFSRPER